MGGAELSVAAFAGVTSCEACPEDCCTATGCWGVTADGVRSLLLPLGYNDNVIVNTGTVIESDHFTLAWQV